MKNQTSYRFVRQTCFATSLLLCLQHPAQANRFISQAQAVIQQLEPGKPIERDISGGQAHSYTVALRAGEYVRLTADQKGIDLSMVFAGPDGKEIVGLNLIRPGGVESLSAGLQSELPSPAPPPAAISCEPRCARLRMRTVNGPRLRLWCCEQNN